MEQFKPFSPAINVFKIINLYVKRINHGPPQPDKPPTPIPPHPPLIMESRMIVATIPKNMRMPTILRIVTPTLPSLFANMARHPIERNKQHAANGSSLVASNPANKKKKAVIIDSGASTSKGPI
jgi:hypothetical protein